MLKLKGITKKYDMGNGSITMALKGIDLEFRSNEFAAVLGQSGCGKTTLLNIIGGLDGYTDGDLFINKKSTKEFVDGDWDSYRNSSVGFVFQSYNLIMHQTVLQNVELALTLVGLPKAERLQKSLSALQKVGLLDQRNKKPNQMSGGQMQRVAIARAIVNDPEILLADEPTGALDTESSVQIMDILKEVAKDRLVIMVTHNPDLADQYANRIIRLNDGNVASDSNPFFDEGEFTVMPKRKARRHKLRRTITEFFTSRFGGALKEKLASKQRENEVVSNEEYKEIEASKAESKKTAMRWPNALKLSFSNLITKKMRTALTAVAGSIGIIGIALVLALSTGVSTYLASVEENSLSTYPIEINQSTFDIDVLLDLLSDNGIEYESYPDSDEIYVDGLLSNVLANFAGLSGLVTENDIVSFKSYLEESFDTNDGYYSYVYDVDMRIYSELSTGEYMKVNPINFEVSGMNIEDMLGEEVFDSLLNMDFWGEMSNDQSLLDSQYDIIGGAWPTESNEIVIVVDEENKIDDFCLFALGLLEPSDVLGVILGMTEMPEVTIDTLLGLEYTLMANSDFYTYNEETGLYDYSLADSVENKDASLISTSGTTLEVVGVVRAKEGVSATAITGVIAYSSDLVVDTINRINDSEVVLAQIADTEYNVVTGDAFTSASTYESALSALGVVDIDDPEGILLYSSSFDGKDNIISLIEAYNLSADVAGTDKEIAYVDSLTVMMSYISSLTNTISAVLIGFSAISLIVSSIMISIITYTSVLERTKEIGVLRSLGARKRDISRVFNAETTMIGFMSGLFGVIVTALLCIPVNLILYNQFGISSLCTLQIAPALLLVAISVIISNIAGFLPARMAASCDPVKALRTE